MFDLVVVSVSIRLIYSKALLFSKWEMQAGAEYSSWPRLANVGLSPLYWDLKSNDHFSDSQSDLDTPLVPVNSELHSLFLLLKSLICSPRADPQRDRPFGVYVPEERKALCGGARTCMLQE